MKYQKIVLAGGNGYLGGVLARFYKHMAHEVVILSRKSASSHDNIVTIVWDGQTKGNWIESLTGADMLINLCGKNVNCRYTAANKHQIIESRVVPTVLLGNVIAGMSNPPKLWINVTSATIYRHAEDYGQDEIMGEMGKGFSVEVCKQWEKAFFDTATPLTRKIALRMGIVFGVQDGVFPRLLKMVKMGLGGKQGNGWQKVAWIHEQDVARITHWLMQHPQLSGVINCTAPQPVSNTRLMQAIRNSSGVLWGLPAPRWLLEIGAVLIGTETELILKSRWVLPQILLNSGYIFQFANAGDAIHHIIKSSK